MGQLWREGSAWWRMELGGQEYPLYHPPLPACSLSTLGPLCSCSVGYPYLMVGLDAGARVPGVLVVVASLHPVETHGASF